VAHITPVKGLSATVGLYSHAVPVPADSRLLFVSGQLSVDANGEPLAVGDFEGQLRVVFGNLVAVVRHAGGSPESIIKMTTYLVDADHVSDFYEARARLFTELFPSATYPGNTLLVVNRLVKPEFLLEIEAVAAIPLEDVHG
jgi:enamine deaminase RidA (YjgF/YER057c/UK114 family)